MFGASYRDNFFAALFNMQKVTRHVLEPSGATFKSRDSDFVVVRQPRLPPDRRPRRRRRQPARRRHRRLVQAVLPDLAAGEAGRARRDLSRPPSRRASDCRPAGPRHRLGGLDAVSACRPTRRCRGRPCSGARSSSSRRVREEAVRVLSSVLTAGRTVGAAAQRRLGADADVGRRGAGGRSHRACG